MIETITLPAGYSGAQYGAAGLLADESRQLAVPQYVAKALLGIGGVTGLAVGDDVSTLLAGTQDTFELNYLFLAYGQPVPTDTYAPRVDPETGEPVLDGDGVQIVDMTPSDIMSKAISLFAARGQPAVSLK